MCDNCHVQELSLVAEAYTPKLRVSAIDGHARDTASAPLDTFVLLATVPGSASRRRVSVTNARPLPLPFAWAQTCVDSTDAHPPHAPASLDDSIAISPPNGVFAPHETLVLDVDFAPTALGSVRRRLWLRADASWPQGEFAATHSTLLEMLAQGAARAHPACVTPTALVAPGITRVGDTVTQVLRAMNPVVLPQLSPSQPTLRWCASSPPAQASRHTAS